MPATTKTYTSSRIEELLTERKALRANIAHATFELKCALLNSSLIRAQIEQRNILKAKLHLRHISFEIAISCYTQEIDQFERIINEQTKI